MVATDNLNQFVEEVPQGLRPRFREIVQLVDTFCDERLDGEYREVCRRLLTCYCQPETGIERGKAASWAAGVIYEAGQINFLSDASFEPFVKSDEIAKGCGVSPATMQNKARRIREALQLSRLDTEFIVNSRLANHPLAWLMELPNGMIVDIRNLPDEVAEQLRIAGQLPEPGEPALESDWKKRKAGQPVERGTGLFYTLKISLSHISPPIWRRVQLPDCLLAELHFVIQNVMGWEDYHLHTFEIGEENYAPPPPSDGPGPAWEPMGQSTEEAMLSDVIPKTSKKPFSFKYVYDFGDHWEHVITVEKAETLDDAPLVPVCLAGKRACPPEDCGGPWGYAHLLEALADPQHPEHGELSEWVGEIDSEEFSVEEVNKVFERWQVVS